MPANLPPHYQKLEEKLRQAREPAEKLSILEEMYALLPKHKGTDKMQADLKKKMSKLRQQPQGKGGGKSTFSHHVKPEGAGQVVLVGAANAGKSALLRALTAAEPEVADYPYTTRKPLPGMMAHEDVPIQLVDLPPFSREFMENWVPQVARYGDALLLVVDLGDDAALDGFDEVLGLLRDAKIAALPRERIPDEDERDVTLAYIPTLVIGAKADSESAAERLEVLRELYGDRFDFLPASIHDEQSLKTLAHAVFDMLRLMRAYSKTPGKPPDLSKPFVLERGATLEDFARHVHKDFAEKLSFARVWGEGKHDGQRVNRDFELSDKDIVELHL